MAFIRAHQLSFMLFMSGVSAILSFTMLISKFPTRKRKGILALMAFCVVLILLFERYAYIFRGNEEPIGFYMVRISNGFVFFLMLFILHLLTQYLKDILLNEGMMSRVPVLLRICEITFTAGAVLLVISQFTGLYYTFDEHNVYHRSPALAVSYVPCIIIVTLQIITVLRSRRRLSRGRFLSLLFSIILPTVASIIQLLSYGVSLTCMSLAFVVIIYYTYMLIRMNKSGERARAREIEFYKESRRLESALFSQTVEALVNAIDAKDIYTHGHSSRVAVYSREIAEKAGLSKDECEKVYFAALLHDVGKIGISDAIINKVGKLTDKEYEEVKRHTILGQQILSSIKQSPSLCIGAHYHHERYDGSGYPEKLTGEEIPEIARIIAVADAYDAMASNRSYRNSLPKTQVIREIINGIGTQFDPVYAGIMLRIIENENRET